MKTYFSGKSYLINFKLPCKIPHYFYLPPVEIHFYTSCFVKCNLVVFSYPDTSLNGFSQIVLSTIYKFAGQYIFKNSRNF